MRNHDDNQNVLAQAVNDGLTMSSREIAEICGKRHTHVLRDIDKMLAEIDRPKFGSVDLEHFYTDSKGETRREYLLPKDLTVTLITGYRADLRYKVVKRLEELEHQKSTVVLPDFTNPAIAARAWADVVDEVQVKAAEVLQLEGVVEEQKPTVDAYDRIAKADGSMCITDAAKALQMRPKDLFAFLRSNGWTYRRPGTKDIAYSSKTSAGLLVHKVHTMQRDDGTEKVTTQVRVTPKGLARLAEIVPQPAVH